ncbi:hypothetical protein M9H77_04245 [Catharanthus roseus]|uniref:Uncharacterized protein n=1 Tax=Catharanthus roseus TaxID=4058 RepID=A0ACC0CDJ3_CATRO|nr:hypothetical protein M9H77_04245 [Catharanthus roseus]
MKHGMMKTFMKIMETILMLAKHSMVAVMKRGYKTSGITLQELDNKEDTPKLDFKDHSKPNVEEKRKLVTNTTRCFKCNAVGYIAINCPTKRTLVLSEDLNGWIDKSDNDFQETTAYVEDALKSKIEELDSEGKIPKLFTMCSIVKEKSREQLKVKICYVFERNHPTADGRVACQSSSLCDCSFEAIVSARKKWPSKGNFMQRIGNKKSLEVYDISNNVLKL